jgi:hypothetical protein
MFPIEKYSYHPFFVKYHTKHAIGVKHKNKDEFENKLGILDIELSVSAEISDEQAGKMTIVLVFKLAENQQYPTR